MNLNCLIVDDEQLARNLLKGYVDKVPFLILKGMAKNPLETIELLDRHHIDIIFLDIQMPELTGIEFLKSLRNPPKIIFTTAYSEYALEGYELDVVDYLVKPFSFERFIKSVNKVKSLMTPAEATEILKEDKDFIMVNADRKIYKIKYEDILFIEGLKEYVSFYIENKRIVALASLKNLEEKLPSNLFIRIHKSYIIPISKIKSIDGNQVDIGMNKLIPIGRSYRDIVFQRFLE